MLVAERHDLLDEAALVGDVASVLQPDRERQHGERAEHEQHQRDTRDRVRSRAEKLRQTVDRPLGPACAVAKA